MLTPGRSLSNIGVCEPALVEPHHENASGGDDDYSYGSGAHRFLAFHDRISLDLNKPVGVDEAHDLHDRVCGADASKELAVDCRNPFPILYSGQQNSGAGHIRKLAAHCFDCRLDYFETSSRLTHRVTLRDCLAFWRQWCRAGDCDNVPGSHCSRDSYLRLEWRTGRDMLASGAQSGSSFQAILTLHPEAIMLGAGFLAPRVEVDVAQESGKRVRA